MITVTYSGRPARTHVKGLVTGRSYGYHSGGDTFQIHESDLKGDPRFQAASDVTEAEPVVIAPVSPDDFTKIKGLTKKHIAALQGLGIATYQDLLTSLPAEDLSVALTISIDAANEIIELVRKAGE